MRSSASLRLARSGSSEDGCGFLVIGDRFQHQSRLAEVSVAKLSKCQAFVEGNVLGLAALYLILRRVQVRMVRVAVDLKIACAHE